jgi:integrase
MISELELALSRTRDWIEKKLDGSRDLDSTLIRRRYVPELYAFSDWRGSRALSKEILDEYVDLLLRTGYSPVSVRRAVRAIRWLLERLLEIESRDTESDRALRQQIVTLNRTLRRSPVRAAVRPGRDRGASRSDLRAILQTCAEDGSPRGVRDGAIVGLLWATGISHSALVGLTLFDVRSKGNAATAIAVKKKGGRERALELPALASDSLSKWLKVRGKNLGPLFYGVKSNGGIQWGQALTESSIRDLLRQRLDEHKSRVGPI